MDFGAFELQIFVSLIVVLGAAFVALVCDYLKGSNEQLREHNIELRVRKDEQERRGILTPPHWLEQLLNAIQSKPQLAVNGGPQPRTVPVEPHEAMNSWASRQDLDRTAQRGASMSSRRWREPRAAGETSDEHRSPLENWVSPETMARVAATADRSSGDWTDHSEDQAAAVESKPDIRDEILKLVEASPRPRRGKPETGARRSSTTNPVIVEQKPTGLPDETEVAMAEPETAVTAAGLTAIRTVVAAVDPIRGTPAVWEHPVAEREEVAVPARESKRDRERIAQTRQHVSARSQVLTQFQAVQVAPLDLEEELHRLAESNSAETRTDSGQVVSALLDEVIAVSSQPTVRQPEPEPMPEPVEPAVMATSRPLLEVQIEFAPGDFPKEPEAVGTLDVVVPVQTVAEAVPLAEVAGPSAWETLAALIEAPEPVSFHQPETIPLAAEPQAAVEPEAMPAAVVEPEAMPDPAVEHEVVQHPAVKDAVIEYAPSEEPEIELPIPTETAFSLPPPRYSVRPRPVVEPIEVATVPAPRIQPEASVAAPRNLIGLEDSLNAEIAIVPEPAVFQAMIENVALLPIADPPAEPVYGNAAGSSQPALVFDSGDAPIDSTQASNNPLPGESQDEPHGMLLPSGMHDRPTLSRLIETAGELSGVVVSISLNDYRKIQDSLSNQAFEDLMRSVGKLMNGMIRDEDFGAKLEDSQWIFVFRNEVGAVAQKRILQISEKLWDFQLRSMGSVSILFGWGAVEVENERLSEAYNAAIERMEQSRRGRKTVAMDTRDKRRIVNG